MCGIAGILGPQDRQEGLRAVTEMTRAMRHRGPDGFGAECVPTSEGRSLFLGHARLSILDLSEHAAQPMRDPATGSWLVYNGEVYNFAALRGELQAMGRSFESTGDTEVVLKSLLEWGPQALLRLRGMYAFAFWDARNRRLILGRDPVGIKPLLLARIGDSLLFASELRGLAASGLAKFTLDPLGVQSFLTFGTVIEPATIIEEVVHVPPGHVVVVDAQGRAAPPRRILGLDDLLARHGRADRVGRPEAVARVRGELTRSVREHLVSDVPTGVLLSGGVDSSILATLADSAQDGRDIHFLTVCFPEREFSELGYAKQVARGLRGRHHAVHMDAEDLLRRLPPALAAMDQPTVDGINTFIISKIAAEQGIKVLLSGLGGDELFGGYTTFWKAPLLWRHRGLLSRLARHLPCGFLGSETEWLKMRRASEGFDLRDAYLLQRSIRWSPRSSRISILGTLPDNAAIPPEAWDLLATDHRLDDFRRISYLESVFYMRNQLLRDADVFSSANSVEMRVPFLDLDLVETAWSLPATLHSSALRGGKLLLKSILGEMHPGLPLSRRKMGFMLPWEKWLRGMLYERVADTIHTTSAYPGVGVEPGEGREILQAFMANDPAITWSQVWSLFVLLDWHSRVRSSLRSS
ncbi:MAG: asparagine synthase (glutamine-hydrolyzing) [Elusimicrobia bacterium]|nr:asparagine synthase (glutamine-hydrolyzing) [Elusimicrobiota bacterium]